VESTGILPKNLRALLNSNCKVGKNLASDRKSEEGFALLEVALALIIMGIVASFSFPLIKNYTNKNKIMETKQGAEIVMMSLANYLAQTGALPCPGVVEAGDAQFGQARASCTQLAEAQGIVPYKTLGIPEKHAKDGFGHFFTYTVTPALTKITASTSSSGASRTLGSGGGLSGILGSSSSVTTVPRLSPLEQKLEGYCRAPKETIRIEVREGLNGAPVLSNGDDYVAVVLVSHGENGHGAFQRGSGTRRVSAVFGPGETANTNGQGIFLDRPISLKSDDYFDDFVFWVSRTNFVMRYLHVSCGAMANSR
jgi:type II secretory pathway pseudopilin PulG